MADYIPFMLFGIAGMAVLGIIMKFISGSASSYASYYPWITIVFSLAVAVVAGGAGMLMMQKNPLGEQFAPFVAGLGTFFGLSFIAAPMDVAVNGLSPDGAAWVGLLFGLIAAGLGVFIVLQLTILKPGKRPAASAQQGYTQGQQQQYPQGYGQTAAQPQQQYGQQPASGQWNQPQQQQPQQPQQPQDPNNPNNPYQQ